MKLKQISGFTTIKSAWIELEKWFSSRSKGRILQLRQELLKSCKGSQSVTEFVVKLKSAGYGLTEEDKVLYLIAGLERDFEYVVSAMTAKLQSEIVTLADAISLMLSHES